MKAPPWIGVCGLLLLQSCTELPSDNTSPQFVNALPYYKELTRLDNPDSLDDVIPAQLRPGYPSALSARFSNADKSRLLSTETNYFNNEIDTVGVYQYTADVLTQINWYNNAGVDGVWQTNDDVLSGYHDHAPQNPDVNYIIYRGPGVDLNWFTADDDILYYYGPVRDAAGTVVGIGTFTLPGDDNVWFTADDFIGWLTTENTQQNERLWVMYLGAGPDNDWLTLDDNQVYRFARTELNAVGLRSRHTYFNDVGADGLTFTADDGIVHRHEFTYDALDRIESRITFRGPGADQLWNTADDFVHSCKQQNRDANDVPFQTVSYRPGPDQTCFTTDDIIWGYHDDTFNSANLLTESKSYYQPGADTVWFTADDTLIYTRTYR